MTEDRPAAASSKDAEVRDHILAAAREMSLTRRHPVAIAIGTGIAGLVAGAIATAALFPLWAPAAAPAVRVPTSAARRDARTAAGGLGSAASTWSLGSAAGGLGSATR